MNAAVPLRERVLAAAAATPSLNRRQGRRLAAFLTCLSIGIVALLFAAVGGIDHARERPFVSTLRIAEGWGLATLAFSWLVLGRTRSTFARAPHLLRAATWASPVVLVEWMLRFAGAGTGDGGPRRGGLLRAHARARARPPPSRSSSFARAVSRTTPVHSVRRPGRCSGRGLSFWFSRGARTPIFDTRFWVTRCRSSSSAGPGRSPGASFWGRRWPGKKPGRPIVVILAGKRR